MNRTIHRAKYVLASPDLVLHNAAVHVSAQGRISSVKAWDGRRHSGTGIIDWGTAVIMPGLVNAHTHLELSGLRNMLDGSGPFTRWLRQVKEIRGAWTPDEFVHSIREGGRECLQSGTTLVGEISHSGLSAQALQTEMLRKVVFEEVTALLPEKASEVIARLKARLDMAAQGELLRNGISPHAPYTVSPELYTRTADLARTLGLPVATHVAESRDELKFLECGAGTFMDLLRTLGVLPADWTEPGMAPIPYLERLGVLGERTILIHCNYLDADSMSRILETRSSVVYCPRSSAFFGHENHPVRQLLDLGINVALGTDSLASNDSLSMLDEMRFLSRMRPDLKPDEILRMATVNGAKALGFDGNLGRLARGYWADLVVLKLPEQAAGRHLPAQILEGAGECSGTIVQGNVAWSRVERV